MSASWLAKVRQGHKKLNLFIICDLRAPGKAGLCALGGLIIFYVLLAQGCGIDIVTLVDR